MTRFHRIAIFLLGCWLLFFGETCETAEPAPPAQPGVFDLPRIYAQQVAAHRQIAAVLAEKNYAKAEGLLNAAVERVPHDVTAHYNLACVLALQGKTDAAFGQLQKAVELGWRDAKHLAADPDLESLRKDKRFTELVKSAKAPPAKERPGWKFTVKPAEPADGQVLVTEDCTLFDPKTGLLRVFFHPPQADADTPIAKGMGEAGELLLKWSKDGTAAGNWGDFYDNHDTDHSNMNYAAFPQLTRIEYSEAAKKRRLHHGLQERFLFNQVTIGNSSTALVSGPEWRCQGRFAITRPNGPQILALQYLSNQLYFYPEHRDHDPGHNGKDGGYGDVFPANTPYLVLSQGSSGSDRAFLNAVAVTLAAFRPKVKEELQQASLLLPAVQMIFRMSNNPVAERNDYLTGKAHPTVFDGKNLNVVKMVELAHSIEPDVLPPFCQIAVVEEDLGKVGRDYFDVGPREKLFDTPCAVARVVKSSRYNKRMVLSAENSRDLQGKPLKYHWKVLRGDAERITIKPLNEAGSKVELIVPYHTRQPISPGSPIESNRVDIGVFVENEKYFSAPAFVSFYYLDNELRRCDMDYRQSTVIERGILMLRSLCVSLLILAAVAVLAFKDKIWRPEEAVVLEEDVEKWLSNQESSVYGQDFIVKARTIARDAWGKDIETWMKIEHVFYGPGFLKGQQFRVVSPKENYEISGPFHVYPAPGLGDVGIWRLGVCKNRLDAFPRLPYDFCCPIPAFQKNADDYKTALAFSMTVEEVSQFPERQKQLSRLKQLAHSQESEIACWATGVLWREKPDAIVDFLRGVIADEKSTVAAQVIADKALMELDRNAWQYSDERIAMVKKWVHGKSSLRPALMFDGLSGMRMESFGIGNRKLLKFLTIALLNEDLPVDDRLGILQGFRDYPKQYKDEKAFQDEIFQVLTNVMLKSKDQSVKRDAAHALVFGFSFESKKRQAILRELMESKDSGEGGRFLREHLDIDSVD